MDYDDDEDDVGTNEEYELMKFCHIYILSAVVCFSNLWFLTALTVCVLLMKSLRLGFIGALLPIQLLKFWWVITPMMGWFCLFLSLYIIVFFNRGCYVTSFFFLLT